MVEIYLKIWKKCTSFGGEFRLKICKMMDMLISRLSLEQIIEDGGFLQFHIDRCTSVFRQLLVVGPSASRQIAM